MHNLKSNKMKNLLLAVTVMLFGYSASAQNTKTILDNYLSVKNALVNSDSKTASEAVEILYKNIKSENDFSKKEDLLKAVDKLNKAGNLEKQRAAFSEVSDIMWKLVETSDQINQPVYYQYCPMKKAYWLSTEKEIKNPYYGASMLTCGKVSETKK
jgi:hypothetical protein